MEIISFIPQAKFDVLLHNPISYFFRKYGKCFTVMQEGAQVGFPFNKYSRHVMLMCDAARRPDDMYVFVVCGYIELQDFGEIMVHFINKSKCNTLYRGI